MSEIEIFIDEIRMGYEGLSNPLKIYRSKKHWTVVLNGNCGLQIQSKQSSLTLCFSEIKGELNRRYSDRKIKQEKLV